MIQEVEYPNVWYGRNEEAEQAVHSELIYNLIEVELRVDAIGKGCIKPRKTWKDKKANRYLRPFVVGDVGLYGTRRIERAV